MHRFPSSRAFTLIEMITVIAIIAILSGLVLGIARLVQDKGNRARAETDKVALSGACEAYKTDNGGYPQDVPTAANGPSVTSDLDAKTSFNPSSSSTPTYAAASLFLYTELTGDTNHNGQIDATETGRKYAAEFFKPSRFDVGFKTSGTVSYISDPYGYSYGYSTAGLKAEQVYRVNLIADPTTARPSPSKGYNPTFDLWSTAGSSAATNVDQAKWIKNW